MRSRRCVSIKAGPDSASTGSSRSTTQWACSLAPAGQMAMSSHGILPTSIARCQRRIDQREAMGAAGRYRRHRGCGQWSQRRASSVLRRRRHRHPDRRRAVAELRPRKNRRGLLQLCADRFDARVDRLSVHRQSRLQRRSWPRQRICRAFPLAVLTRIGSLRASWLSPHRRGQECIWYCSARQSATELPVRSEKAHSRSLVA